MIGLFFLRVFTGLFRIVPFRVVYILSDGLAFLLFTVVGYRKKVVLENLRRAFPDKNEEEILRIARLSYRNLTDVTLETVKSIYTPIAEIQRRCRCLNPEVLNRYIDKGQTVILTGSHCGNWEYSGLAMPPAVHGPIIGVYKPLTNKGIDRYLNSRRSRTGLVMVSMDDMLRTVRKSTEQPVAIMLLSDQSPSNRKSAHWVEFLGVDSASLPGADVLARKFNFPVVHYHINRVRRGFYEINFSVLCDQPSGVEEMGITRMFARTLEAEIRANPEQWLWSHKRWKIRRDA